MIGIPSPCGPDLRSSTGPPINHGSLRVQHEVASYNRMRSSSAQDRFRSYGRHRESRHSNTKPPKRCNSIDIPTSRGFHHSATSSASCSSSSNDGLLHACGQKHDPQSNDKLLSDRIPAPYHVEIVIVEFSVRRINLNCRRIDASNIQ